MLLEFFKIMEKQELKWPESSLHRAKFLAIFGLA